jgi:type II secretory pathway pseudopilin PulG
MRRRGQRSAGFTLIEVGLALGVAAFALVAIFGLLPIGLNSNQASLEQTAAAGLAASLVADLRAAPVAIPPMAKNSPRFQVPLPAAGSALHTLFLREDGSAAGSVDANADPAQDPRYRATLFITAPEKATQKAATIVRVLLTWPVLADPQGGTAPRKFSGSFEVVTALDRN